MFDFILFHPTIALVAAITGLIGLMAALISTKARLTIVSLGVLAPLAPFMALAACGAVITELSNRAVERLATTKMRNHARWIAHTYDIN